MKKIKLIALLLMLTITYTTNGKVLPPPMPGLSIDQGIWVLIISAIVYSVNKIKG